MNRVIACAAVLFIAASAGATVLIDQDFEAFSTTSTGYVGIGSTTSGRFGWLYDDPASPPWSNRVAGASDTAAHSGSNSVALCRVDNGAGGSYGLEMLVRSDDPWTDSGSQVTADFWLKRDTGGAQVVYLRNTNSSLYEVGLYIPASGRVAYRTNGTSWAWVPEATLTLDVGEWYGLRLDVDTAAQTYDVYFSTNNTTWTQVGQDATYPTAMELDRISTTGQGAASTRVYMDDVTVSAIPEPSSAIMLGLAGLAMLYRRYHR